MEKTYKVNTIEEMLITSGGDNFGYHFSIDIDTLSEFLEDSKKLKSNFITFNLDYTYCSDYGTEFDGIEIVPIRVEYEDDESFNKRLKAYDDKIENDRIESEKRKKENEIELLKKLKLKYPSVE